MKNLAPGLLNLLEVPLAHRGLWSQGAPENSRAAFRAALAGGYGIELDVQRLADGEVVVFHDETLDRLAGRPGRIPAMRSDELGSVRLCGSDETPPLLRDVLTMVRGRVPLYVEIKNRGMPGPLETRVLELVRGYAGPVAIASFNPAVLGWFRRREPGIVRGQIASHMMHHRTGRGRLLSDLRLNVVSRPDFVAYDLGGLPRRATDRWRARGGRLVAWTARCEADVAKSSSLADNYVFEGFRP
jgi:glycerophosphoryl diester phosphodiesterase